MTTLFNNLAGIVNEKEAEQEKKRQLELQEQQKEISRRKEWLQLITQTTSQTVMQSFFEKFAEFMGVSDKIGTDIILEETEEPKENNCSDGRGNNFFQATYYFDIVFIINEKSFSVPLWVYKKTYENGSDIFFELGFEDDWDDRFDLVSLERNESYMYQEADWSPIFEELFNRFQSDIQKAF